ncbi:hypothetical protein GCM10009754_35260 [Amycolatopsis minnesotensis]|uniref:Uncharacterized protein n=1 Tax=Amycolatopsis minnesotensis TaxID=337894 RepID=A0ABN2R0U5_9PSEU
MLHPNLFQLFQAIGGDEPSGSVDGAGVPGGAGTVVASAGAVKAVAAAVAAARTAAKRRMNPPERAALHEFAQTHSTINTIARQRSMLRPV